MYAGTFKVSPDQEHHLFYWFIKNTAIPDSSLVIWINGGPGSSSLSGLFYENGPLRAKKTGPSNNDFVINISNSSWVDLASIVYVDQPVGVGFSYG